MSGHDRIRESLRADLELARKNHEQARKAFLSLAGDPWKVPKAPSGLPRPYDREQIRAALRSEREARRRHLEALQRFNYFAVHGTTRARAAEPEELEKRSVAGR